MKDRKSDPNNKIVFSDEFEKCKSKKKSRRKKKLFRKNIFRSDWFKKISFNRKVLKRFGLIVLVIVCVVTVGYFLTHSTYFEINEVEFHNENGNSPKYLNVSKLQSKSQHLLGQNYFTVNIHSFLEDMKKKSLVEYVYIQKKYPNKVVFIIKEREPTFVAEVNKTNCVVLDDSGYVIAKTKKKSQDQDCLEITNYKESILVNLNNTYLDFRVNKKAGGYIIKSIRKIRELLNNNDYEIKKITLHEEFCQIDAINYNYNTKQEMVFVFDLGENINKQAAKLEVLYSQYLVGNKKVNVVDLRYDRPVLQ